MRTLTKSVYYCDHCRKHGLSRHAMELHERICTLNPERDCRWRVPYDPQDTHGAVDLPALVAHLKERPGLAKDDIDWLHDEVAGCPACMLAALRQCGQEFHYDSNSRRIFDYGEAVEELRKREREEAYNDRW